MPVPRRKATPTLTRQIGRRIRLIRKECGMTQERLAELLRLSQTHLSQIESGRRLPSIAVLFALARYLSVAAIDLVATDRYDVRTHFVDALRRGDRAKMVDVFHRVRQRLRDRSADKDVTVADGSTASATQVPRSTNLP